MYLRICGSFKSANLLICDLRNIFADRPPLLNSINRLSYLSKITGIFQKVTTSTVKAFQRLF
jgi:hypothetical protein